MVSNFVPYYLGFSHISREAVIQNYSSPLATQLVIEQPNTSVLVIDGTYLYIQVRSVSIVLQLLLHLKNSISKIRHVTSPCYVVFRYE